MGGTYLGFINGWSFDDNGNVESYDNFALSDGAEATALTRFSPASNAFRLLAPDTFSGSKLPSCPSGIDLCGYDYWTWAASPSGQYIYYVLEKFGGTASGEYVIYAVQINNGVTIASELFNLLSSGYDAHSSDILIESINNNGSALVCLKTLQGTHEYIVVDKSGNKRTILSNLDSCFSNQLIAMNDLGTVFVGVVDPVNSSLYDIYAFMPNGASFKVAQTGDYGSHFGGPDNFDGFYASDYTAGVQHPEGVLYYRSGYSTISGTDGSTFLNTTGDIGDFFMNANDQYIYTDENGVLYNQSGRITGVGDTLDGRTIQYIGNPSINGIGQVAALLTFTDGYQGIYATPPQPQTPLDLSIVPVSDSEPAIMLTQPAGVPAPLDSSGNAILATTTPPNATPVPKQTAVTAQAEVIVNMTGTPSVGATTDLQLALGGQIIADQSVNLGQLQQGPNTIYVSFPPPTDPSALGVLPLTATINASKSVTESNYSNNSSTINVNTMVLCTVAQAGTVVPFYSQGADPLEGQAKSDPISPGAPSWSEFDYGIVANSHFADADMWNLGCSVTDLAMLFNSYGIDKTPIGSPAYPATTVPFNPPHGLDGENLDPGQLDYAMANYRDNFISKGSVGFDANNDPDWAGAAEIARAGFKAQCTGSVCDPSSAVSFKYMLPDYSVGPFQPGQNDVTAAIAGIQDDICSGNPVILKFSEPPTPKYPQGGQHFMLATGIVLDKNFNQTIQLNNPGTKKGKDELYSSNTLTTSYPTIIGGALFRPSADPMMMFITAPLNVQLVITDPEGRKTGYDPITGASYSQIPGATYEVQSINTPNEVDYAPETLVAERYFVSSANVLAGDYMVTVYGVSSGSYYVDYRGFDSTGTTNKSILASGTIATGQSTSMTIAQSSEPAPVPNANLAVRDYSIWYFRKRGISDAFIHVQGNIRSVVNRKLEFNSDFKLMVGGVGEYTFDLPLSSFEKKKFFRHPIYRYHDKDVDVMIEHDGDFVINVRHADLSNVNQFEMPLVTVEAGNLIGQKFTNLICRKNKCSTRFDNDRDDRDHDQHSRDEGSDHSPPHGSDHDSEHWGFDR